MNICKSKVLQHEQIDRMKTEIQRHDKGTTLLVQRKSTPTKTMHKLSPKADSAKQGVSNILQNLLKSDTWPIDIRSNFATFCSVAFYTQKQKKNKIQP